jgi:VWFA-related protein
MFFSDFGSKWRLLQVLRAGITPLRVLMLCMFASMLIAQSQDSSPSQPQQPQQQQPSNPNQQEAPPAAGGPQNDIGPYVIPKKKDEPPPPPPEKPKKIENMPDYSISVQVPLVNVDVLVTTKDGQTVPGLNRENFKVFEDGQSQQISTFNQTKAPITAVLLIEFAAPKPFTRGYQAANYIYDALNSSYTFARTLEKDDWVAVESYDIKPYILVDFTQDKRSILGALNSLRVPGFSETNLFDAVFDTLDRIDRIEGKKYVILISSGADTFSKINLDQCLKKVKSTKDVTIYPISIGAFYRTLAEPMSSGAREISWAQNDNQMETLARLTGGRAYFPKFQGELPEVFGQISSDIRNQYSISYHPSNTKLDGTYRKLKVELQAPDGGPLKVRDQKGKEVKYVVYAREGYTAKHTVE